ncbi:ICOS ligand isoform X2 [Hemicordylus capensis]|uniref:ICOS ligand isoform X2 n=1 Tax=Hemicordylus capensis TaxID=884348 RepID=UPI0023026627|nr:ICOS ligand isoform X2 [Hemicordylus capensis]
MLPKSLGLLLVLFLWIQRIDQSHQCREFSNRTRFNEKLKEGDFSLTLLNISRKDEHKYECIIQRNENVVFAVVQHTYITLKVAANYSNPVLTGSGQSEEEMNFTCSSSHGYPKGNIYWINQTDNSLLDAKQVFTEEPDGTFRVSSTLTTKRTSNIKLECIIENKQLNQNLTTTFTAINNTSRHSAEPDQPKTNAIVIGGVATAIVILAIILSIWLYKRQQRTYTDVCQNEAAANCNAPAEIVRF